MTGQGRPGCGGGRIAALALLMAAACSSAPPRGSLPEGERLYRAKCSSCHRTYEPRDQTPDRWTKTVDKMIALKKVTLTPEEREQILQYLSGSEKALR